MSMNPGCLWRCFEQATVSANRHRMLQHCGRTVRGRSFLTTATLSLMNHALVSGSSSLSSRASQCPLLLCYGYYTYEHNVHESYRSFATSSRRNSKKKKDDPFVVLGIQETDPYKTVKRKFLQIAMSHHPDTAQVETEEERDALRDVFIRARRAFEALAEGPDGEILLQEEAEAMNNFDSWFRKETGHENPFQFDMDPATMQEVAEMTEQVGGVGLDRDGGMWQLAKMVTNAVQSGSDGTSMLRLEAGEIDKRQDGIGVLRRRRKPRR